MLSLQPVRSDKPAFSFVQSESQNSVDESVISASAVSAITERSHVNGTPTTEAKAGSSSTVPIREPQPHLTVGTNDSMQSKVT